MVSTRTDRPRYLRVEEAAIYLRLSPETVRRRDWRERAHVPSLRAGPRGKLLFDTVELDAWLRRRHGGE
jgi:hypothetical protein